MLSLSPVVGASSSLSGRSGVAEGVDTEDDEVFSSSFEDGPSSFRWDDDEPLLLDLDLISIMVLLLKHVHLQKVGAAASRWVLVPRERPSYGGLEQNRGGRLTGCSGQRGQRTYPEEENGEAVHLEVWDSIRRTIHSSSMQGKGPWEVARPGSEPAVGRRSRS